MKYIKTKIILSIVVLFVIIGSMNSCELLFFPEERLRLPDETSTGENTLGAVINGKLWVPGRYINDGVRLDAFTTYFMGKFKKEKEDPLVTFSFSLSEYPLEPGIYYFNSDSSYSKPRRASFLEDDSPCSKLYFPAFDYEYVGKVEITRVDYFEKIISGRFDFDFTKEGCEPVFVKQGRFDWNYK